MKVYVVEYDFQIMKVNLGLPEEEHRIESFTDVTKFIDRVKYLNSKYYNTNITTYTGEVSEIHINKVLNPL